MRSKKSKISLPRVKSHVCKTCHMPEHYTSCICGTTHMMFIIRNIEKQVLADDPADDLPFEHMGRYILRNIIDE